MIKSRFDGYVIWVSRSVFMIFRGVELVVLFVAVRENEEFGVSKNNEFDEVVEYLLPPAPGSAMFKQGEDASIGLFKICCADWIGVKVVVGLILQLKLSTGDWMVGVGVTWWANSCSIGSIGWVNQLVVSWFIPFSSRESASSSIIIASCRSIGAGCDLFNIKNNE